jgi:hypothetical protein
MNTVKRNSNRCPALVTASLSSYTPVKNVGSSTHNCRRTAAQPAVSH